MTRATFDVGKKMSSAEQMERTQILRGEALVEKVTFVPERV